MEKGKFKIIEKGFSSDILSNIEQSNINGGGYLTCSHCICNITGCPMHVCGIDVCSDWIFEPCKDLIVNP